MRDLERDGLRAVNRLWGKEAALLRARVERLEAAIRQHRMQRWSLDPYPAYHWVAQRAGADDWTYPRANRELWAVLDEQGDNDG